jgi:hypothetical protein
VQPSWSRGWIESNHPVETGISNQLGMGKHG